MFSFQKCTIWARKHIRRTDSLHFSVSICFPSSEVSNELLPMVPLREPCELTLTVEPALPKAPFIENPSALLGELSTVGVVWV